MPSQTGEFKITIIWEEEIRAAAKALSAIGDNDEQTAARIRTALDACWAALANADDDESSLMLSRKPAVKEPIR